MAEEHRKVETAEQPERTGSFGLREAWLRVRAAHKKLGLAEAEFAGVRAEMAAARALAGQEVVTPSTARAPTLDELEDPEPLSEKEAEQILLGSALRTVHGLEQDVDALRQRMIAEGAAEPDIHRAVLTLVRNRAFGAPAPERLDDLGPLEHREWVGAEYALGIGGQRVAVMGFSHWGEPEDERESVTEDVIAAACAGQSHAFFDHIQRYFGFDDRATFWNQVLFFNYLPDLVGTGENRYAWGTRDQHDRAWTRFHRILDRRRPDKLFVFSMKAWESMPAFRSADPSPRPLGVDLPRSFEWGTYDAGLEGHVTAAFGLRHPQGASKEVMIRAVQKAMKMPFPG